MLLAELDVMVVEVDAAEYVFDFVAFRNRGKSDPTDAVSAARAALSGTATVTPKSRNGRVEDDAGSPGGPTVWSGTARILDSQRDVHVIIVHVTNLARG